jgi:hypothetical protein
MNVFLEWLRRIWYLLNRRRFDEMLRQEMEAHQAMMDDPQRFGNALRLREEAQDAWGWRSLDNLVGGTRLAIRCLGRVPRLRWRLCRRLIWSHAARVDHRCAK